MSVASLLLFILSHPPTHPSFFYPFSLQRLYDSKVAAASVLKVHKVTMKLSVTGSDHQRLVEKYTLLCVYHVVELYQGKSK
jgi:hypothetical protein